jgi:hypothetical protein
MPSRGSHVRTNRLCVFPLLRGETQCGYPAEAGRPHGSSRPGKRHNPVQLAHLADYGVDLLPWDGELGGQHASWGPRTLLWTDDSERELQGMSDGSCGVRGSSRLHHREGAGTGSGNPRLASRTVAPATAQACHALRSMQTRSNFTALFKRRLPTGRNRNTTPAGNRKQTNVLVAVKPEFGVFSWPTMGTLELVLIVRVT